MQLRFHIRQVAHPFTPFRTIIERIGIRIDIDTFKLAVDNSGKHRFQFRIGIGQLYIRPYLGPRVTEPHGMNISCIYKSIGFAVFAFAEVYGGIQCIGETIGKHPGQL